MRNDSLSVTPAENTLDSAQLSALIEASKLFNASLDRDVVLRRLMVLAARGVHADRATLYLLDKARDELCSIVVLDKAVREIHLPLDAPGEGLAGHVARTGETVNVADAYTDPRFSRRIDEETGYRTGTVLAVPMRDPQGKVSGVLQVLNKHDGPFSGEDERYLLALAEHASLALENARLHTALTRECQRLSFLYRVSSLMTGTDPSGGVRLRDVLLTVMEGVTEILEAESSAILLWDRRRRRPVFVAISGPKERELIEIDVPMEGSIAGWVMQNEQAIIVNDAQRDPRLFRGADERTGLVTRTLMGVPIVTRSKVLGVLEVMNKQGTLRPAQGDALGQNESGALFDEADLQLAQAVADHTALAIESARHYESLLRVREYEERRAATGILDPLSLWRG